MKMYEEWSVLGTNLHFKEAPLNDTKTCPWTRRRGKILNIVVLVPTHHLQTFDFREWTLDAVVSEFSIFY